MPAAGQSGALAPSTPTRMFRHPTPAKSRRKYFQLWLVTRELITKACSHSLSRPPARPAPPTPLPTRAGGDGVPKACRRARAWRAEGRQASVRPRPPCPWGAVRVASETRSALPASLAEVALLCGIAAPPTHTRGRHDGAPALNRARAWVR